MKSSLVENTVTSMSMATLMTPWMPTELLPKIRTLSLVSVFTHRGFYPYMPYNGNMEFEYIMQRRMIMNVCKYTFKPPCVNTSCKRPPPSVSDHVSNIPKLNFLSQTTIVGTSHKQPSLVSDHLSLTFWVVAYGRFDCISPDSFFAV